MKDIDTSTVALVCMPFASFIAAGMDREGIESWGRIQEVAPYSGGPVQIKCHKG